MGERPRPENSRTKALEEEAASLFSHSHWPRPSKHAVKLLQFVFLFVFNWPEALTNTYYYLKARKWTFI
jgi:hypothetical protein